MSRYWTVLPLLVLVAVPVWTAASSAPVVALAAFSAAFGALGIGLASIWPITTAGVLAIIGYALALWLSAGAVNIVGAAVFGMALLFFLDLSAFAARFGGAEVAPAVIRAQLTFWFGRGAIIIGVIALLTLGGFVLTVLLPADGRVVVAGAGALIAFAAALHTGVVRNRD